MKLLEFEAKSILKQFSIPVPASRVITKDSSPALGFPCVLKSQVPVGGRGKAGGIKIVQSQLEADSLLPTLLNLDISGFKPKSLLAEELLEIQNEYYLSLVINKSTASIELVANTHGGVEVEENLEGSYWKVAIGEGSSFDDIGQSLSDYLELPEMTFVLQDMVENLYNCFTKNDALLLEINPLVLTKESMLVAGDCKMELDNAAAFRHTDWNFEDEPTSANFVTLNQDGSVATIANGAGLAMATVDAVVNAGLTPANFLDIGGGANKEGVLKVFDQIVAYPNIKAIVINIFAGITRCDEVARAIIAAKKDVKSLPPLFIRLNGTNSDEAVKLLERSSITTLPSLEACLVTLKKEIAL